MDSINVTWGVNVETGSEKITLEEVECRSMDEWRSLDVEEQKERLQSALDGLPERTVIIVDKWDD
jgi:hypothetical protein